MKAAELRNPPHVPPTSAVQTCVDGRPIMHHASRITHLLCTSAERIGGVGAMDAERLSPRRESGEAIWDGEEVSDENVEC
jgi:hypothetical protein